MGHVFADGIFNGFGMYGPCHTVWGDDFRFQIIPVDRQKTIANDGFLYAVLLKPYFRKKAAEVKLRSQAFITPVEQFFHQLIPGPL